MLFKVTRRHARVAVYFRGIAETLLLNMTPANNALADGGRAFLSAFAGDVAIFDCGHFNVQIDSVEQRTRDALAISLDLERATAAFAFEIAKIAARTGIHCSNQHEL